jgi:hypothetical protein
MPHAKRPFANHGRTKDVSEERADRGSRLRDVMIDRARLLEEAKVFENLDQAFRWAVKRTPRLVPDDVVIQDEYTHDVLFRAAEGAYLVFDTT